MHITDKLCKARRERDESQARYEQALAEHREAYPWLVIEERKQPTEDMSDPANWRAGDVVECVDEAKTRGFDYFTTGKFYQLVLNDGTTCFQYTSDDGDYHFACNTGFRFHSRP